MTVFGILISFETLKMAFFRAREGETKKHVLLSFHRTDVQLIDVAKTNDRKLRLVCNYLTGGDNLVVGAIQDVYSVWKSMVHNSFL